MGQNLLVINIDIRETRVALIENGIIAELHIERENSVGSLGNIYVGKVSRVLPGMQAAFIDVGLERAAFLHVEDLIRPNDFEGYLSRMRGHDEAREEARAARDGEAAEAAEEEAIEQPDEEEADAAEAAASARLASAPPPPEVEAEVEVEADAGEPAEEPADVEAEGDLAEAPVAEPSDVAPGDVEAEELPAAEAEAAPADEEPSDDAAEAGEAEAQPGDAEAQADEAGKSAVRGGRRRRRAGRVRRSGSTRERAPAADAPPVERTTERQEDRRRGSGRGREGGRDGGRGREAAKVQKRTDMRISKSTPIRDVVREGQEVLVQVSKEPIGTKGARVTSHISLAGRYVVYLPTVEHVGVSKRIGSEKERNRLRDAIDAMKPPTGGVIVRTLAEGLTKKQLKADVGYLVRLWGEIIKKRDGGVRAPTCVYSELDLVLKSARDLFTDDIGKIVIDSREEYARLKRFMEIFMPERAGDVELYEGSEPIFDAYGIEDEIQRALGRKVPLPSGGYLILDQAEALTAIDVNTGRFVGKGSKDHEETILQTNLEAVEEIAYQLRFRNIGGLIILDLIDMERAQNREKVRRRLEDLLSKDKAKTTVNRISELGLIEMTRKRTRESLGRTVHEPCFYCDGTGQLQSKQTIAYEILRQIRRERDHLPGYSIVVNAHPAVVDFLKKDERDAVTEAERLFSRRIDLVPRTEYHLEQFDLQGR